MDSMILKNEQDGTALSKLMSFNYSYSKFSQIEINFPTNKITKLVFKSYKAQVLIFP